MVGQDKGMVNNVVVRGRSVSVGDLPTEFEVGGWRSLW